MRGFTVSAMLVAVVTAAPAAVVVATYQDGVVVPPRGPSGCLAGTALTRASPSCYGQRQRPLLNLVDA